MPRLFPVSVSEGAFLSDFTQPLPLVHPRRKTAASRYVAIPSLLFLAVDADALGPDARGTEAVLDVEVL